MRIKRAPFLPPKPNPFFLFVLQLFSPFLLGKLQLSLDVSEEDLSKLKSLSKKRLLLLPNHPSDQEPFVMFELAKRLNTNFYGVAAREVFDWKVGLQGIVFQLMGAYSLIRGSVDRDSFRTTREILVRGEKPLVIFIEGEVSNENDTLIPFEPGVVQFGFWALDDLLKLNSEFSDALYLVPVAIKYFYDEGCKKAIDKSIKGLEDALDIESSNDSAKDPENQRLLRINKIAQTILNFEEKRLALSSEGQTINQRVAAIREKILKKLEIFLEIPEKSSLTFLERIRRVRNMMDKATFRYQDSSDLSDYEQSICSRLDKSYVGFYEELERLQNFLVIREGYIAEKPEPERYIEVLRRFEREVYGKDKFIHPKTAKVMLGKEVNLLDFLEEYKQDKKQTLLQIANNFEQEINDLVVNAKR